MRIAPRIAWYLSLRVIAQRSLTPEQLNLRRASIGNHLLVGVVLEKLGSAIRVS
jgi:hypothetical protein